jgi:hypothetical protein
LSLAANANSTFCISFLTTYGITSVSATAQTSSGNGGAAQLSTSAIIGIAVAGGVVGAAVGLTLLWFILRRMKRHEVTPQNSQAEYETVKIVEVQPPPGDAEVLSSTQQMHPHQLNQQLAGSPILH